MGNPLSVVAKIQAGQADALEMVLNELGDNIRARKEDFQKFQGIDTLHFCRFVLIPMETGDKHQGWAYLHFESNFDGDLDTHLDQFVDCAGDRMKQIWGKCEGFPANADPTSNPDDFKWQLRRFIKKNSYYTPTFYQAYPRETSKNVQLYTQVGKALRKIADMPDIARLVWENRILQLLDMLPPKKERKPNDTLSNIGKLVALLADLFINGLNILFWQPIKRIILRREPKLGLYISDTIDRDPHRFEDVVAQNAMTIVSPIRHPNRGFLFNWYNMARLKFFLLLIGAVARRVENQGSLGGISTIHFARWFIIDNGRYLLFNSNYDGSWDNYIGDFVDLNAQGMDWVWQCTPDYPYATKDMEGFKRIIREYQMKVQVYYSAVPDSTVFNILADRDLTNALDKTQVQNWMKLV